MSKTQQQISSAEVANLTIFELVKKTLEELYEEGLQEYGTKLDETIKKRMSYLSQKYADLTNKTRTPIDYRDPATRFAYVFKYVASHGDYLVQTLQAARSALGEDLFKSKTLRLSCIGGGPGSDVVGVLKYLSTYQSEPPETLTCYLLDGEQAWADTWTEVGESLESDCAVNVNFQKLDVKDPNSWSAQKKFLKADIFTLSYFVSEVVSMDTGVITDFWKKMFDEAKSGALFVDVDNGSESFNDYFDLQWVNRGDVERIVAEDNSQTTPRSSEQTSDLGVFRTKFAQSPKLKSRISYRVLRKE